jgi:RHS repeat-associated protein
MVILPLHGLLNPLPEVHDLGALDAGKPASGQCDVFGAGGEELGTFHGATGIWWEKDVPAAGRILADYVTINSVDYTRFLHSNALGSLTAVTNEAGSLYSDQLYYPWGQLWQYKVLLFPERFAGLREFDSTTNLYGSPNRGLDPSLGRWMSPDPDNAGADDSSPQSWNGYAYVMNSPETGTDPEGLACVQGNDGKFHDDKSGGQSCAEVDAENKKMKPTVTVSGRDQEFEFEIGAYSISTSAGPIVNTLGVATTGFVGGATGATAVGALTGSSSITTLGLSGLARVAPLLPAVPSALAKLQQLGISLEEANEIVASPTAQKFIDNLHDGNINVLQKAGSRIIRITLDPASRRIVSAGIVQARNVANSIASGRLTPLR